MFVWLVQILLGVHTLIGAFWKFSNTAESTMPSLVMLSGALWTGLGLMEIIFGLLLILPLLVKSTGKFVPLASLFVGLEMLFFCVIHLKSGAQDSGPLYYWLVVTIVAASLVVVRFRYLPIRSNN